MTLRSASDHRVLIVSVLIAERVRFHLVTALLLLGGVIMPCRASAQALVDEDAVKAAYLHKFPGYVEWPAGVFRTAGSPFVVGVIGADRVLSELTQIADGRLVQGRPVEAVSAKRDHLPGDLHVLFVGRDSAADVPQLVAQTSGRHVLIVTDTPSGLQMGAALNFVDLDGRLRFEASLTSAQSADLKLGSGLLGVAVRVVGEAR